MSAPAQHPCPAPGCNNAIDMIMPQCDHCRRKHCMAHRVPESHGCRDAVKAAALLQTNADAQRLREDRKGAPSDAKAKFEAKKAELAAKRGKK